MLMRLFWGVCIFSLGYYIGRETAQKHPDQLPSTNNNDFLKGDFADVGNEAHLQNEES